MSSTTPQKAAEWVAGQISLCRPRARFWLTNGSLSVLDEGMIAGSNFLIGVLLARWLVPDQYGAYALAYSLYLALAAFYRALILEPIAVFGPSYKSPGRRKYLGSLLKLQAIAVLPVIAILGGSSYLAGHLWTAPSVASALVGLTVAAPFLLIFSFTRFSFYLDCKPDRALSGAVIYCAIIAVGLALLYRMDLLSPLAAFLLMMAGALVSGAIQLARLKPAVRGKFHDEVLSDVWNKHWTYGRWSLPTSLLVWLPANLFYFLAGSFCGIAQAGALKALTNFIAPVGHLTAAFSLLLTPYVAKLYGERGALGTHVPVQRINTLYFIAGLSYCVVIGVFGSVIFHALYANRYSEFIYLVPWAAVVAALNMAGSGSRIGLRALQSPSSLFVAYCAAGVASIGAGIPLVWVYGVPGAIAGSILASAVMFTSVLFLFRKKVHASAPVAA